jgi:hypothetical protein
MIHKKLSEALYKTRDSLAHACYDVGVNIADVKFEKLTVCQCMQCDIWDKPARIEDDICEFCNDYASDDTL